MEEVSYCPNNMPYSATEIQSAKRKIKALETKTITNGCQPSEVETAKKLISELNLKYINDTRKCTYNVVENIFVDESFDESFDASAWDEWLRTQEIIEREQKIFVSKVKWFNQYDEQCKLFDFNRNIIVDDFNRLYTKETAFKIYRIQVCRHDTGEIDWTLDFVIRNRKTTVTLYTGKEFLSFKEALGNFHYSNND